MSSTDPWKEQISYYLSESEPEDRVTGKELLSEVFEIQEARQERHHFLRIASVMRQLGWETRVYSENGKSVRGYSKADSERVECLRWARR